jgi:hypothetical protein
VLNLMVESLRKGYSPVQVKFVRVPHLLPFFYSLHPQRDALIVEYQLLSDDDLNEEKWALACVEEWLQQADTRDWQTLAIRNEWLGRCDDADLPFASLPYFIQWLLSYAALNRDAVRGDELFRKTISGVMPDAKYYLRESSISHSDGTEEVRFHWIIHLPMIIELAKEPYRTHAFAFVRWAARMLLPFYHSIEVCGPEPFAYLSDSTMMHIGYTRVVSETIFSR